MTQTTKLQNKKQRMTLAGLSIAPHLSCLRWCGFCRLSPNYSDPKHGYIWAAHGAYRGFVLLVTNLYMVQEFIYAYRVFTDLERFSRVMFLLMVHISNMVKLLVFHYDADRIDKLINTLDDPDFNENTPVANTLQLECAESARKLQRVYSGTAVVTCTLWIIFPSVLFSRGLPVEFFFWSGVDYSNFYGFLVVLMYSYYVTTLVGIGNTTMDAFMATIMYQCKTQFTILRKNLENLFETAEKMKAKCAEDYETCVLKLLVRGMAHHKKICKEVTLLQEIFGFALLVQFAIGGWILGMAFYKVASLSVKSMEFVSIALFIICILTELFLYCFYGNEVAIESGEISNALYASTWQDTRPTLSNARATVRVRRALILVMVGARQLKPRAGWIILMSLDTYLKILKISYSFYTILRQTKEN